MHLAHLWPATLGAALAFLWPARRAAEPFPFGVGERLVYDGVFGKLRVGSAELRLDGLDTVRGREAFHAVFTVRGGLPLFRVDDTHESWFDVGTMTSYRFHQRINEVHYHRERTFEILPDSGVYVENETKRRPTVAEPLDEVSFLYFLRTQPLELGRSYELARYFRPDRNPVRFLVERRERVTVPAGTFDALVLRPVIKTTGIFSEGGRAEVWVSDDERRLVVQLKSQLTFGSINLYLRSYEPGQGH
jgi:hypothetical protein